MNVYVIASEGGMCKIGKANDPAKRMRELSTGHPFRLSVAHTFPLDSDSRCFAVERKAHEMLSEKRMAGEWFEVPASEAAEIVRKAVAGLSAQDEMRIKIQPLNGPQVRELLGIAAHVAEVQRTLVGMALDGTVSEKRLDELSDQIMRASIRVREALEAAEEDDV